MEETQAKFYLVNGPAHALNQPANHAITLLTNAQRQRKTQRRSSSAMVNSQLALVQTFDFPQASNRVKTTPDGQWIVGTGLSFFSLLSHFFLFSPSSCDQFPHWSRRLFNVIERIFQRAWN